MSCMGGRRYRYSILGRDTGLPAVVDVDSTRSTCSKHRSIEAIDVGALEHGVFRLEGTRYYGMRCDLDTSSQAQYSHERISHEQELTPTASLVERATDDE